MVHGAGPVGRVRNPVFCAAVKELSREGRASLPNWTMGRKFACSSTTWCRKPKKGGAASHADGRQTENEVLRIPDQPAGGREKNEDRMGYCYTKASGLFMLADGMAGTGRRGGSSNGAAKSWRRCTRKRRSPTLPTSGLFGNRAVMTAHRQILRYAAEKHLMDTPRAPPHCGTGPARQCTLGALRRLAPVFRGQIAGAHAHHSTSSNAREANPTVPVPSNFQPQRPLHLPGFAHQTGVRHHRAGAAHARADRWLCSDGLWGSLADPGIVLFVARAVQVGFAVPELVERALAWRRARTATTTAIAVEGNP